MQLANNNHIWGLTIDTAAIAKKYWKKAECVFVVADYEQALWIVPSAAFLSAPILVQPDPKHMISGGQLQLGGKITPGDYVFQVIVTDKLAKEKYRVATQAMDFEIQAAVPPQQ